jgi:hypothetical protein
LQGDYASTLPRHLAAERPFELKQLYTDPDRLGRGLGARLMDWARAEARKVGADVFELSVYADNPDAQRFYARYGLNKIADITFKVGEHIDPEFLFGMVMQPERQPDQRASDPRSASSRSRHRPDRPRPVAETRDRAPHRCRRPQRRSSRRFRVPALAAGLGRPATVAPRQASVSVSPERYSRHHRPSAARTVNDGTIRRPSGRLASASEGVRSSACDSGSTAAPDPMFRNSASEAAASVPKATTPMRSCAPCAGIVVVGMRHRIGRGQKGKRCFGQKAAARFRKSLANASVVFPPLDRKRCERGIGLHFRFERLPVGGEEHRRARRPAALRDPPRQCHRSSSPPSPCARSIAIRLRARASRLITVPTGIPRASAASR